nr:hypothetical protein [Paraburkholderia sp. SOS3]
MGFCDIGEYSFLGVNATLANNLTLATDNWLDPNRVIVKTTEPSALFKAEHAYDAAFSVSRMFRVPT